MNRREFIKLLSASAMVPVIALPAVAPGAPAVESMETNGRYIVYLGRKVYFVDYLYLPMGIPPWLCSPQRPYGSTFYDG